MNSSRSISSSPEHPLTSDYSQPTDRRKEFADIFSASLEQQCDGALNIMLEGARKDRDPEMVRLVGQHLVHANADQRQTIVSWTTTLSHEQRAVFDSGSQTGLRNALEQNHPCLGVHLELVRQNDGLCREIGYLYKHAAGWAIAEIDRWSETLDSDQLDAFLGGKRAKLLTYATDKSSLLDYMDANSMARLSLVSKEIQTQTMKRPRFEAVNLMKDFPDCHRLPTHIWVVQCEKFLHRIMSSECAETKVEGLTRMAGHIFPRFCQYSMRQELLAAINTIQPSYLRAQPLAALMTSVQKQPVFTSPAPYIFMEYPDPDWPGYDLLGVGPLRVEVAEEDRDEFTLRALWQSAMNLDPEWQRPVMTALLNRSCGPYYLINTILKEVHESDNEHWKSTLLIALGDCYRSIDLHNEAQAEVVLTLMKQTKGEGPEFLALKLLPDYIAKKGRLNLEEFSILLDFISTLAPSLQKPSLLALAETLAYRYAHSEVLNGQIEAMLKVCQATEDRDFEYALRLEVNKGIHHLEWHHRDMISHVRFEKEALAAVDRFEGDQRTALLVTLGRARISDILTTNLSKRIDTRTLIALAATGQWEEADALKSHLLQFPESDPPKLLVALIRRGGRIDINYFVDAIRQLPVEQQTQPLRALMYRCRHASAQEMSQRVLALGELCRQSPCRAEMLRSLSLHCIGAMGTHTREAVPMPLELFDAIHNDIARMSDVDRCAAYFALKGVVGLYAEEVAAPQRAKLQTVFESLERLKPAHWG